MTGCGGFLVTALPSARLIRFMTSWPMSATKIQKFRLRELLGRS